ncbi:MAG: hydroxyacid dehydrogenase [Caldilineaceae bacterium]|nr:hydroxyacid dehydrogenase [Caldilineaceae bacterium]
MKPKVWSEVQLHPEALARIQAVADVIITRERGELPGAEVAVIGGSTVDDAFLDQAGPTLKMVIRHGIGYNAVDVPACTARGVLACNTPDGPTESTAEHTVTLLLSVAKRILEADTVLRHNQPYSRAGLTGVEVRDKVLGVVGFGRIGRRVTDICALGLRMRVLVYDPFLNANTTLPDGAAVVDALDTLLAEADFVTVHAPLAPETHHLISDRAFGVMKRGAYLINASRGPVVDEAALIRALQSGHLAGAGLDVFDPEPPHPDNPLLQMPNVIATPHVASNTDKGNWRMSQGVADQVIQLLAGERPTFVIDAAAWPGRMGT